tara:strand:- start:2 stop:256 length:255 start_codon:yes stop_codon:yes gene_type:complete
MNIINTRARAYVVERSLDCRIFSSRSNFSRFPSHTVYGMVAQSIAHANKFAPVASFESTAQASIGYCNKLHTADIKSPRPQSVP